MIKVPAGLRPVQRTMAPERHWQAQITEVIHIDALNFRVVQEVYHRNSLVHCAANLQSTHLLDRA